MISGIPQPASACPGGEQANRAQRLSRKSITPIGTGSRSHPKMSDSSDSIVELPARA